MAKIRTMSLILCLSIVVAIFGLYRIDSRSNFKDNKYFLANYNTKASIENTNKVSKITSDKNNN